MKKIYTEESLYTAPLRAPRMNCDGRLTDKHEIKAPWPSGAAFFLSCIGPPGSGKTTAVLSAMTKQSKGNEIYHGVFRKITYVCPLSSQSSIINTPLADLEPSDVFSELSSDVFDKVYQNFESFSNSRTPQKQRQLIIIDDCGSTLKSVSNQEMLNQLSMNRRHLHLSIILVGQYSISIPRATRAQLSNVCLYKPSRQDRGVIQSEFTDLTKAQFNHLAKYVWKDPHDALWVNLSSNEMHKNLEKLVLE